MTENRMLEAMKKTRLKNVYLDEKIKLILSDLDITISGHKFALLLDFKRPDIVSGYSMSIKAKKRNLKLQNGSKLQIEDANEFLSFSKN